MFQYQPSFLLIQGRWQYFEANGDTLPALMDIWQSGNQIKLSFSPDGMNFVMQATGGINGNDIHCEYRNIFTGDYGKLFMQVLPNGTMQGYYQSAFGMRAQVFAQRLT